MADWSRGIIELDKRNIPELIGFLPCTAWSRNQWEENNEYKK